MELINWKSQLLITPSLHISKKPAKLDDQQLKTNPCRRTLNLPLLDLAYRLNDEMIFRHSSRLESQRRCNRRTRFTLSSRSQRFPSHDLEESGEWKFGGHILIPDLEERFEEPYKRGFADALLFSCILFLLLGGLLLVLLFNLGYKFVPLQQ